MNPLAHWNQSRWNQLNEIEDLQHTVRSLSSHSQADRPEEEARPPERLPLVYVSEDAQGYVIKAELPQVKKEGVKITMDDGMLTITGERKFGQNNKKDRPPALACGRFVHCFAVPTDARPARVTADFTNEILTVHLLRNENGESGKRRAEPVWRPQSRERRARHSNCEQI